MDGVILNQMDLVASKEMLDKVEDWITKLKSKAYPVGGWSEAVASNDSSLVWASKLQSRGLVGFSWPPRKDMKWWIKPHLLLSFLSKFADCLREAHHSHANEKWALTLAFHGIKSSAEKYADHPNVFNTFLSGKSSNNMRGNGIYLCKTGHVARMYGTCGQIPVLVLCKTDSHQANDLVCDFTRHVPEETGLDDNCFRVRDASFTLPLGRID
jgi:G3E family GTPase